MLKFEPQLKIKEIFNAAIFNEKNTYIPQSASTDYWEMVYVTEGAVIVTKGRSVLKCRSGTAVFHKPNEMHCIKAAKGEKAEYCIISFSAEGELLEKLGNAVVELSAYERQLMLNLLMQINGSVLKNGIPGQLQSNSYLAERFVVTVQLLILYCIENESAAKPVKTAETLVFSNAVDIMEENVLRKLSVGDLADKLNISLSHLKRTFAEFTTAGVHEYFMELKVNRAKKMLKEGISVTKTAELTGFNNQNYFSAAFKRITGVSPKEFSGVKKISEPRRTEEAMPEAVTETRLKDMPSYLL